MPEKEYIDRIALIKAIAESTESTWGNGLDRSWWSHSVQLKDNIVKCINNQIAADVVEAPKWISVEERLPEESGDYLVYFAHHAAVIKYSAVHRAFNAFDDQTKFGVEQTGLFPRYWMPLPEPPREVDEG